MKVFVELTLGHRATIREKATAEGYTHDWEIYVRSDQGQIQAFVDRVIFHLHESFPKPRRVVKEPPFIIKESGYAGFIINIEIHFKNKEEPKKAEFGYDLYLQSDGPPITPSRKEKLIFNFPSEEFAKKLFKGGGVVHKEKDSNRGDSSSSSNSSVVSTHSGGKSAKHTSTNSAKASPKNSFETLFGTPIKRSAPSLTTSTVSGATNPGGPSKDPKPSGKSGKGDKAEKIFGQSNGVSGIKSEKLLSKAAVEKGSGGKASAKSPMLDSPSSDGSNKPSSSKSSKSERDRNSSEKRIKEEDKTMKMLPPENSAVPKKSRKSELFVPSPSSTSTSGDQREKPEKTKKRSSKHVKVKLEKVEEDFSPSTPENLLLMRDIKIEPDTEDNKEQIDKSQLSPISSRSTSSSTSSTGTSSVESNSEGEAESEPESEHEEMIVKSNKRIAAANSTSSSRRRSQRSDSESGSEESPVGSPPGLGSPISSCSSGSPSPAKRRKISATSSSLTPDHTGSSSLIEKPNSSSSFKIKKERHQKRGEKKSRKSRKKSKKQKEKVFEYEESGHSDSSISSVEAYSSTSAGNGISSNSNGLSPSSASGHSNLTGTMTPEMRALQELYNRIANLEDPEKLQEVVDIVEGSGRDSWTMESGFSFDFDLCKLSSLTIKKIQEVILD